MKKNISPDTIQLSGALQKEFEEALLKAFPENVQLERMIRYELDQNLEEIAGTGSLRNVVYKLVEWARKESQIGRLLRSAISSNPNNDHLKSFEERYSDFVERMTIDVFESREEKTIIVISDPENPGKKCVGVDRKEQLDIFKDNLERIRLGLDGRKNFLEWFGSSGIGKSSLISILVHECHEQKLPYIPIEFNRDIEFLNTLSSDPIKLFEYIASRLDDGGNDGLLRAINEYKYNTPIGGGLSQYCEFLERKKRTDKKLDEPEWYFKLNEVASELRTLIQRHIYFDHQLHPLVLFFDGCEALSEELRYWIEEFIIEPLIFGKQCVFVWMDRQGRQWGSKVRNYRLINEITNFGELEVREQLEQQLGLIGFQSSLAIQIYRSVLSLTGGHPYANWVVVQTIGNWIDKQADNAQLEKVHHIISNRESELCHEVFEAIIANHAFKNLPNYQREALIGCSIIRKITPEILQAVSEKISGSMKFDNWELKHFQNFHKELRETGFLHPHHNSLILDPNLRWIVRRHLLLNHPDEFKSINQLALQYYSDALDGNIPFWHDYIVEELYHGALLNQLGYGLIDIFSIFNERLKKYYEGSSNSGWLNYSLNSIQNEILGDKELERIVLDSGGYFYVSDLERTIQGYIDKLA